MQAWIRSISRDQWRTLGAAQLGWMLDALDVMLYAFALTAMRGEFGLSSASAGALASVTLLASAAGGVVAGVAADRYGRVRVLVWSILSYSLFTAFTATAQSVTALIFWRALVGIGLGGEWSAGSVLVAETWPAEHRGKAIGIMQAGWAIGYLMAAGLAALVLPRFGWRVLFVAGVLPALLAVWIQRRIPEPALWRRVRAGEGRETRSLLVIFRPPLLKRTVAATLMCACVMFAYWGLFTWMPTYLSTPAERGGAGMSIVRTSGWIVPVQVGAFFGYILFGWFADRLGRRPAFAGFVLAAAVVVPLYTLLGRSHAGALLALFAFSAFSVTQTSPDSGFRLHAVGLEYLRLFAEPPWFGSAAVLLALAGARRAQHDRPSRRADTRPVREPMLTVGGARPGAPRAAAGESGSRAA